MKNLFKGYITIMALGLGFNSNAQGGCTVTAVPPTATIICGEEVLLSAQGQSSGPVLFEDFNAGTLGAGWSASQTVQYNNPCGPSLDGTPSAWMGSTATQPRELITVPFDLQCGATICFDLDFAGDENNIDCEDPDAAGEGVYLRYSIDNGATWVDITYFQPNAANTGPYYQWANYCFALPPGGWSANTMFQWRQDQGSSANWDHWGIDNVSIQPVDCGNAYYYVWNDNTGNVGVGSGDSTMSPTVTTIYDVDYTNGIDDTCQTQFTVTVNPFNIDIICDSLVLDCGECTSLDAILSPSPNNPNPNYQYTWTPAATLASTTTANTTACPSVSTTYQVDIVEANSGCSASETIDITMNSGSAIAEFTPSVLAGCAPLVVNFTNTSTGQGYIWNFGDGSPIDNTTNPSHTFVNPGTYTVSLTAQLAGATCSDSTITVDITVGANITPIADFTYETECGDPTVVFTNTGTPNLTYTWDMGDGAPAIDYTTFDATHTFPSNSTFTVTLTVGDAACGTMDTHTETITIVNNPITYTVGNPVCNQTFDGSIVVNFPTNTGTQVVTISDSLGNQENAVGSLAANQLNAGWYYINVDLGGACQSYDSIYLPDPEIITIDLDLTHVLCNGDATGIAHVDTVYGYQGAYSSINYNWIPDNPLVPDGQGADSSYSIAAGQYTLKIDDAMGCSQSFDFEITEADPIVLDLGTEPAYCRLYYYQNGSGVVFASATGGAPGFEYQWTNTSTGVTSPNSTWGGLNPGTYEVLVQDNNGCLVTQTIVLDSLSPIASFDLTSAEFTAEWEGTAPVSVHYENTSQYYTNPLDLSAEPTFIWNLDTSNVTLGTLTNDFNYSLDTTFLNGGTYTVCLEVINHFGCTDTHCEDIIIFDDLLFKPVNIFTPNGDGDNDVFTFDFVSFAVTEFECVIVNRWGQKVAEFASITDSWDGSKFGNGMCPDGTYFYTYKLTAENGETDEGQGTITKVSGE